MVHDDIHTAQIRGVLREGFDAADDELVVINPSRETMRDLVSVVQELDDPSVRVFVDREPLKTLLDDFLIASVVADLVAEGLLSLRTLEDVPRHSLLLTDGVAISLVEGTEHVAGLTTTDDSFLAQTTREYESRWERAEPYSIRTPPLSTIRETLDDEFGPETAADFDRVLETLDTARGNGDGLDEVTISLLVAANNGELLYEISRWGEDIQLASKATFSRTKNQLEDVGLIDTEKVPIDVGRPRLRLVLGNSALRNAVIETVTERAQDVLE